MDIRGLEMEHWVEKNKERQKHCELFNSEQASFTEQWNCDFTWVNGYTLHESVRHKIYPGNCRIPKRDIKNYEKKKYAYKMGKKQWKFLKSFLIHFMKFIVKKKKKAVARDTRLLCKKCCTDCILRIIF